MKLFQEDFDLDSNCVGPEDCAAILDLQEIIEGLEAENQMLRQDVGLLNGTLDICQLCGAVRPAEEIQPSKTMYDDNTPMEVCRECEAKDSEGTEPEEAA